MTASRRINSSIVSSKLLLLAGITASTLTFDNCLLDQVIKVLDGQYAVPKATPSWPGSVEVAVISPVPFV